MIKRMDMLFGRGIRNCNRRSKRSFFSVSHLLLLSYAAGIGLASQIASAQDAAPLAKERPNILWLTIEDISPYAFGCYGNSQVQTPTIDRMAQEGIRFTQARATGPQCSPARASIISGCQATHYGTDEHRRDVGVPQERYFFPLLLRRAGYFCTNNEKTDYNASMKGVEVWDACSKSATYNDPRRRPDQPFFAVFNSRATHMSRLTTITLEGREPNRLDPRKLNLPPHVPDLPAMRADFALHLEGAEDIDKWVALHLKELEKRGLAEDTIIFFYSDHGGCLPRGKAFPTETGYRVPMIVWAPEKWRDLLGIPTGNVSDRLVGFEDLAPTVLSLAGISPPDHMLGQAFLGEYIRPAKSYQVCFRTNTGHHFDPSRTITDGRFKYIRHFTPYKPHGIPQGYQWQMPSQMAWHEASIKKELPIELRQYYLPKPTEVLYDLQNDPWEMKNLASSSEHRAILEAMRDRLRNWMRETADLGLFLLPRTRYHGEDTDLFSWVRQTKYPLNTLLDAAWMASASDAADIPQLSALLNDPRAEMRFWGVAGFATRARAGTLATIPDALVAAMQDKEALVAATAAEAVYLFDKRPEAMTRLIGMAVKGGTAASAFSALMDITAVDGRIPELSEAVRELRHFDAKAIRVMMGDLPMSELYTPEQAEQSLKAYRRLLNWQTNLP